MRSALAVAVLASLVGLSVGYAAASPPEDQKHSSVTYQINPAHNGAVFFPQGFSAPPTQLWSVTLTGGFQAATTLIAEGKVFVTYQGNGDSRIDALDLQNGQTRWRQIFGSPTQAAYDGGILYVMGATGQLQAFKASNGKRIWFQQLPTGSSAPPTAIDGRLYLDLPGALYALDGATGALLWTQPVTYGDVSSPTVAGVGVYAAFPCQVYRFNAETGHPRWHLNEGSPSPGGQTAAYFNQRLYVHDGLCGNAIVDAAAGTKTGTFDATDTPALFKDDQGTGYGVSLNYGVVTGFSADTGKTLWTFSGGDFAGEPVVINGVVVVGSFEGEVIGLDGKTGAQVWSFFAGGDMGTLTAGEDRLAVTWGDSAFATVAVYGPQQQKAHP